jgi:hypothetical protein
MLVSPDCRLSHERFANGLRRSGLELARRSAGLGVPDSLDGIRGMHSVDARPMRWRAASEHKQSSIYILQHCHAFCVDSCPEVHWTSLGTLAELERLIVSNVSVLASASAYEDDIADLLATALACMLRHCARCEMQSFARLHSDCDRRRPYLPKLANVHKQDLKHRFWAYGEEVNAFGIVPSHERRSELARGQSTPTSEHAVNHKQISSYNRLQRVLSFKAALRKPGCRNATSCRVWSVRPDGWARHQQLNKLGANGARPCMQGTMLLVISTA